MQKEILNSVLDTLVTAVVLLDHNLHIQWMNAAAEDLLQTSASHSVGRGLEDLILRADQLLPSLQQALETGQPYTEREAVVRLPDNITQSVDFTVSIIDAAMPTPSALVLELQPLSRLQRINKDDESAARQETTRQLIRGLAHEIKNPLGGIRGAAQLLEAELPSVELKEYTEVVITEADRLKELVDRMLGPQHRLKIGRVNILKVSEHIIRLMDAENPAKITWRRDYDPSIPDIEADETQIIQAILNIVRNACEAMQDTDDARIQLCSRVERRFTIGNTLHRQVLRYDIIDNGPGIDADLEERIFFPMISGRAEGTGLGLAITQNIIAQHKGSIQLTTKPGLTKFSIFLPFEMERSDELAAKLASTNSNSPKHNTQPHAARSSDTSTQ